MSHYIYSRVSTDKQETENQLHRLKELYPKAEVVEEYISGTKARKPILAALLARMTKGDTLVIAALDRLGRNTWRALKLLEELYEDGITVVSVREGIDYSTSSGQMVAGMLLVIAQNERNLISERTVAALVRIKSEGRKLGRAFIPSEERARAKATQAATFAQLKAEGVVLGRPKTFKPEVLTMIKSLRAEGLSMRAIAKQVDLSPGRICQLLKEVV